MTEPRQGNFLAPSREALQRARKEREARLENEARLEKRAARIAQWAIQREHSELADLFAGAVLLALSSRQLLLAVKRSEMELLQGEVHQKVADRVLTDWAAKLKKQHEDRKRGAAAKKANDKDGKQAARAEATRLWPEATRKGWTAERLWAALQDKGHDVKPDTVRKWLTKLRKTGTC